MTLQIKSIKKLPKRQFSVVFSRDNAQFESLVTIEPRLGNAMDFHNLQAKSALMNSGTEARSLCDLILKVHKGRRLKFPITISDPHLAPPSNIPLTQPAGTLLEVG